MKTKKINKVCVKPIIQTIIPPKRIAAYDLFTEPNCNVALIAKKKSGKTSVLYNCLKKCAGPNTNIYLFSSTINRDDTYKEICDMLEKRHCIVHKYTHFKDTDGNVLDEIIEGLKNVDSDNEDDDPETTLNTPIDCGCQGGSTVKLGFGDLEPVKQPVKEVKPKKERKIYCENIFAFDDLGSDMRNKSIDILLKTNRHFKSKVFLLGHTLTDLNPASRKQLDYALIFKSFSEDKLKSLYGDLDLSIEFDNFMEAYKYATEIPYNFLYISTKTDEIRKNFNEKIEF